MNDDPAWRQREGYEDLPDHYCPHIRSIYECDWCRFDAAWENLIRTSVIELSHWWAEHGPTFERLGLTKRIHGGSDDHTG